MLGWKLRRYEVSRVYFAFEQYISCTILCNMKYHCTATSSRLSTCSWPVKYPDPQSICSAVSCILHHVHWVRQVQKLNHGVHCVDYSCVFLLSLGLLNIMQRKDIPCDSHIQRIFKKFFLKKRSKFHLALPTTLLIFVEFFCRFGLGNKSTTRDAWVGGHQAYVWIT